MTLADDLKPLVNSIRAIPGQFGLHAFTVSVIRTIWTDEQTQNDDELPITHADGQPPHVRFLTLKERYAAGLQQLSIEVGPITPAHSGGGYTVEQLNPAINGQEAFHYLVKGPGMGEYGSRFALAEPRFDGPLGYRVVLELSETGKATTPSGQ